MWQTFPREEANEKRSKVKSQLRRAATSQQFTNLKESNSLKGGDTHPTTIHYKLRFKRESFPSQG